MDAFLQNLRRAWLADLDESAGRHYATAANRSGYLNELWELSQLGDHAAAQEAWALRQLLEFPSRVPSRDCYVVMPYDVGPLSDEDPRLKYFMPHLDGKPISNTPLLADWQGNNNVEIQMDYNSNTWDFRWQKAINSEHYQCPGCTY
jgi:hypothetical protein